MCRFSNANTKRRRPDANTRILRTASGECTLSQQRALARYSIRGRLLSEEESSVVLGDPRTWFECISCAGSMLGTGLTSAAEGILCTISITPSLFAYAIREKELVQKTEENLKQANN